MNEWKLSKPLNEYEKKQVPENRYIMVLLEIKETISQAKNQMLVFSFDITEGIHKGSFGIKPIKYYIVKDDKGYWENKLGNLLLMLAESNNLTLNKDPFEPSNPNYIGLKVGAFIDLIEDEYNGRKFMKNGIKYFCRIKDVEGWVNPISNIEENLNIDENIF